MLYEYSRVLGMALPSVSVIPLRMTEQPASFNRGANGFKETVVISSIVSEQYECSKPTYELVNLVLISKISQIFFNNIF